MRLASLAVAVLLSLPASAALADARIPDVALEQAAQLREQALADDTGWKITESLTTEVGPRLAGSEADA
ncbi:MAG TPA: aminopeptidase, partial [Xanthomonadaceae bacterium]|nr:aminopeptidase [Xanthomonadaceae bacterium]